MRDVAKDKDKTTGGAREEEEQMQAHK